MNILLKIGIMLAVFVAMFVLLVLVGQSVGSAELVIWFVLLIVAEWFALRTVNRRTGGRQRAAA